MSNVVIIGDMINSRSLSDRSEVQKRFLETLDKLNKSFEKYILADFIITIGDEFQGLLRSKKKLIEILEFIDMEMEDIRFRYGIGVGSISSEINRRESNKIDGPAYHRARQMIEDLEINEKSNQTPVTYIKIKSDDNDDLVNALFAMMSSMKLSWTVRQREVIYTYLKNDHNQYKTAEILDVQQSTVNRSLNAANYFTYQYAFESMKNYLESEGD